MKNEFKIMVIMVIIIAILLAALWHTRSIISDYRDTIQQIDGELTAAKDTTAELAEGNIRLRTIVEGLEGTATEYRKRLQSTTADYERAARRLRESYTAVGEIEDGIAEGIGRAGYITQQLEATTRDSIEVLEGIRIRSATVETEDAD